MSFAMLGRPPMQENQAELDRPTGGVKRSPSTKLP
jgi:hypothetical protein